jgi:kumamolisin
MSTPKKQLPLAGSERVPLEGAREIGPAKPNETVDVTIRLRSRAGKKPIVNAAEFTEPIGKRTILSRKEFEQRHGADANSIARVEAFARQHKLTVKERSPARRTVILSGSVAAMNEAFGVELKEYETQTADTADAREPIHLPAELQDVVEGVFGLDNRPQAKPHFRRRQGRGRRPCRCAVRRSYTPPFKSPRFTTFPQMRRWLWRMYRADRVGGRLQRDGSEQLLESAQADRDAHRVGGFGRQRQQQSNR